MVASAQFGGVRMLIESAGNIVTLLTKIAAAVALLVFFWGLVKFIFAVGGDTAAVEQGRTLMIWGTIALFVLVSIWGIILFIQTQLGIHAGLPYNVPTFPRP